MSIQRWLNEYEKQERKKLMYFGIATISLYIVLNLIVVIAAIYFSKAPI